MLDRRGRRNDGAAGRFVCVIVRVRRARRFGEGLLATRNGNGGGCGRHRGCDRRRGLFFGECRGGVVGIGIDVPREHVCRRRCLRRIDHFGPRLLGLRNGLVGGLSFSREGSVGFVVRLFGLRCLGPGFAVAVVGFDGRRAFDGCVIDRCFIGAPRLLRVELLPVLEWTRDDGSGGVSLRKRYRRTGVLLRIVRLEGHGE